MVTTLRYKGASRNLEKATQTQVEVKKMLLKQRLTEEISQVYQRLIEGSAKGPSLALRRLRERIKRLEKRLQKCQEE